KVTAAINGEDALTHLNANRYDLVVTDVNMPKVDGFELTRRIRTNKALSHIPVVLVTSLDSREDKERGIEVGADAYIVKSSFDQSNLLDVIKSLTIMGEDPEIEVVGSVNDGIHALDAVKKYKPDVVTMDIHMRYMNGFDATRSIMEEEPVPIIIVSGSYNSQDNFKAFKALEMGAVTILKKPHGITNPEFEADAKQ
ncbi:chemotaxis-specific protein-glutamate methyltransferase CheB, partial [Aduncisulcus paluster]